MEEHRETYKGREIVVRSRSEGVPTPSIAPREDDTPEEPELLIDDVPIRYGQLPDGSYALQGYAYDWTDDLVDLARRFIDYQGTTG